MILRDQLVEIGHYNKPHGINGEVSATIDCDIAVLKGFSCLVSEIEGIFVPFFVKGIRPKSAETVLLSIEGIDNEHDATMLVNKNIYVKKDEYQQLSDEYDDDALPIDYFIGYHVRNNGKIIGEIVDVDDQTENCLFVVNNSLGRELMIPANEDFIIDIDTDCKILEMHLPDGLIDMQNVN